MLFKKYLILSHKILHTNYPKLCFNTYKTNEIALLYHYHHQHHCHRHLFQQTEQRHKLRPT